MKDKMNIGRDTEKRAKQKILVKEVGCRGVKAETRKASGDRSRS